MDDLFASKDFHGTFVCVGGPMANSISRIIMQYEQKEDDPEKGLVRVPEPVFEFGYEYILDREYVLSNIGSVKRLIEGAEYRTPNWALRDTLNNNRILKPELKGEGLSTDFLLITVVPNILDRRSYEQDKRDKTKSEIPRIIIFGGTHGVGTRSIDLLSHNILQEICDCIDRMEYGQVLVEINGIVQSGGHFYPSSLNPRVKCCPLKINDSAREKWLRNLPSLSNVIKVVRPAWFSLAGEASAEPSLSKEEKDMQPTNEIGTLKEQLFDAFREVVESSPGVVSNFEEAFRYRSEIPGLSEEDEEEGLASGLAGLFLRYPPQRYFDPSSYLECSFDSHHSFLNEFHSALEKVAIQYPEALVSIQSHSQEKRKSLFEFLRALLAFYADNKRALPY